MQLEKGKVITLENGKKYLILDYFTYNNEQYSYISSLDAKHICFVKITDINGGIDIHVVKDEKLIKQFAQNYILNNSNQKPTFEEIFTAITTSNVPNKFEYLISLILCNCDIDKEYIKQALLFLK